MKLPGLIQFRLCTLTDEQLANAVAEALEKMYNPPVSVPTRHIPARPNEDFDLLVGELIFRFLEREKAQKETLQSKQVNPVVTILNLGGIGQREQKQPHYKVIKRLWISPETYEAIANEGATPELTEKLIQEHNSAVSTGKMPNVAIVEYQTNADTQ